MRLRFWRGIDCACPLLLILCFKKNNQSVYLTRRKMPHKVRWIAIRRLPELSPLLRAMAGESYETRICESRLPGLTGTWKIAPGPTRRS